MTKNKLDRDAPAAIAAIPLPKGARLPSSAAVERMAAEMLKAEEIAKESASERMARLEFETWGHRELVRALVSTLVKLGDVDAEVLTLSQQREKTQQDRRRGALVLHAVTDAIKAELHAKWIQMVSENPTLTSSSFANAQDNVGIYKDQVSEGQVKRWVKQWRKARGARGKPGRPRKENSGVC